MLILVDGAINHLLVELTRLGLLGCTNIVVVGDHGMQNILPYKIGFIKLDDFFDTTGVRFFGGTFGQLTMAQSSELCF